MGMVHTLFDEGLVDTGAAGPHLDGLEEVERAAREHPPEAVAEACGIEAERDPRLARELAAADSAAVYGRIGTCTQEFGALASWLVDVLNVLTGNLDREGGAMFTRAAAGQRNSSGAAGHRQGLRLRPLEEPGARAARGAGRAARVVPGRGDRHARRGSGPRADHRRRQPAGVHAQRGAPRAGRRGARLHALAGHLRERDHAPRRRDPARSRPAGEAPLRPGAVPAGRPQRGQLLPRGAAAQRRAPGVGDAGPARRDRVRAGPGRRRGRAWTRWSSARWSRARSGDPHSRIAGRDQAEILAELEPRRGPERILDLLLRTGPYGDAFGDDPDGLTLARLEESPHGIDLGPLHAAPPRGAAHRLGQGRAGAGRARGRRAAAGRGARAQRRRHGAGGPPPAALQQLVDAQPRARW